MTILWNLLTLCCILLSGSARATAKASFQTNLAKEAQDEKHDVEILKAVYTSMENYWMRRLTSGRRTKRADSIACYGDLGCFEDAGPFGYIDMLPSSPEEISTKFQLYSGKSRGDIPVLEVPYSNLSQLWNWSSKLFNVTVPVKIIVHGFGSSCNHEWVYEMKSALLNVEDCNVICVDWEAGALIPNYVRAVANTRLVGKQVAMLIQGLTERGLTLDKVHLIGFSLGAHVAGFAGAELKNVSRITGLDPAGPLFESQDPKARLDESDANFVDVIHSNGETLILGGLGSWQPMGHVDFYPNGGRMQKGCTNLFVGAVSDIIWSASDIEGRSLCNHRRAYKFFTDSVSPRCHFPSFPCESYEKFINGKCFPCSTKQECGSMGYYADKSSARGSLYLITREEEPFCAHQYHVKVESSPSKVPVLSYGKIQITLIGDNLINETFTLTKKDDEELGVGTVLSRIVVPHPALEPAAIEIVYTAYSGWISSGLKTWSIDKVKLGDSYGKSISHCKKDLVLDSKVPVMLKLFPGDCNLPKEIEVATTEVIDPFFIKETTKTVENRTSQETSTVPISTVSSSVTSSKLVFKIPDTTTSMTVSTVSPASEKPNSANDNLPSYTDEKNYYASESDTEKAEANKVIIDSIVPKLEFGQSENYTMKIVRRHEITEPVLQPKFTGRKLKDEVDEPVLKAIEKIKIVKHKQDKVEKPSAKPRGIDLGSYGPNQFAENQSKTWVPPQDLHPPPLGLNEFWGTTRRSKTISSKEEPFFFTTPNRKHNSNFLSKSQEDEGKSHESSGARESEPKLSKNFYVSSPYSFSDFPKNKDGTVTVQFFPQYLAVIMKQAEQYAKMNLFSPLDIFVRPKQDQQRNQKEIKIEKKKETQKEHFENLATPRYLEQTINFLPKIYEYIESVFEKSLENMKSLFGVSGKADGDDIEGKDTSQNSTLEAERVIRNATEATANATTTTTNATTTQRISLT